MREALAAPAPMDELQQLADARAEVERLRPALTGLLDAVDRKDMDSVDCRHFRPYQDKAREALAAPATHPFREVSPIIDKCGECGEHPDHPIHNPAPAPEPPTSEAERPEDWYCGRCSEVVPLGERCRICGATKRESGVA